MKTLVYGAGNIGVLTGRGDCEHLGSGTHQLT